MSGAGAGAASSNPVELATGAGEGGPADEPPVGGQQPLLVNPMTREAHDTASDDRQHSQDSRQVNATANILLSSTSFSSFSCRQALTRVVSKSSEQSSRAVHRAEQRERLPSELRS